MFRPGEPRMPIKDAEKINPVMIDELSSEEFTKWAAQFRPIFVSR